MRVYFRQVLCDVAYLLLLLLLLQLQMKLYRTETRFISDE